MGEYLGEASPRVPAEDQKVFPAATAEVIVDKILTFEQASKCLNTLGKDETGSRYAYLMITATDSKLTDVSIILNFKHVQFIDVSGNYLTTEALQALTGMPFLILLKAERNRVDSASLNPMYYLQVLDLNQNQIKDVANIDQPLLDCLEMNFNDIYTTHFDKANLNNLKQLEMRSNLLFELSGEYPPNLEKLYLAANKIGSVELTKLPNLQILHLRENNIQSLDGFSEDLTNLNYLNLRNNKISKYNEFKKLRGLPKLETLIATGNPLPGTEAVQPGEGMPGEGGKPRDPMVIPLLVLLPNLKRINKTVVSIADRIEAEDMENDILDTLMADDQMTNQETDQASTTPHPTPVAQSEGEEEGDVPE